MQLNIIIRLIVSRRTIFSKLRNDTITALLQLSNIFWETIGLLFLVFAILLSHKILQEHLPNSIIIQFSVEILHYLLILRVAITYLKNIYLQIKEFGIINRKGNKNLGLKASKRKIYKSKALVRKGNKNISHKVSTRRISKSK